EAELLDGHLSDAWPVPREPCHPQRVSRPGQIAQRRLEDRTFQPSICLRVAPDSNLKTPPSFLNLNRTSRHAADGSIPAAAKPESPGSLPDRNHPPRQHGYRHTAP